MEERGRGIYRVLWIGALVAIGAQLVMARQPQRRALAPIEHWETCEWPAAELRIACPEGWKRQQASGFGGVGQEMVISESAVNQVLVRRLPLFRAEGVMVQRDSARRQTLTGLHQGHLLTLRKRFPGLESGEIEIGQVANNFGAWSDVSYPRGAGRVMGKSYTIVAAEEQYQLAFLGEEDAWPKVLGPAYEHMLQSLELLWEEE